MARLHSRKKGKAGTKRPKSKTLPEWVSVDKAEMKETILKMAREGVPASKIGLHLRDNMGVPSVRAVLGVSLSAYLAKEKALPEYPEDMLTLIRKAVHLHGHMKNSKKDVHNKVKLGHIESKIMRLAKYYSRKGRIPANWKYDIEQVALLVK